MPLIQKVVARYPDGRIVKGTTGDFNPAGSSLSITAYDSDGTPMVHTIDIDDLKALFFVKSLEGDRAYSEHKLQPPAKPVGKSIIITFKDGETMRGSTLGTNLTRKGFLLFPSDPRSNNKRIFIVRAAVHHFVEED